jgi:hypothetical protein
MKFNLCILDDLTGVGQVEFLFKSDKIWLFPFKGRGKRFWHHMLDYHLKCLENSANRYRGLGMVSVTFFQNGEHIVPTSEN